MTILNACTKKSGNLLNAPRIFKALSGTIQKLEGGQVKIELFDHGLQKEFGNSCSVADKHASLIVFQTICDWTIRTFVFYQLSLVWKKLPLMFLGHFILTIDFSFLFHPFYLNNVRQPTSSWVHLYLVMPKIREEWMTFCFKEKMKGRKRKQAEMIVIWWNASLFFFLLCRCLSRTFLIGILFISLGKISCLSWTW